MNSLIGLGAATSFAAGTISLLLPEVGLQSAFLEEPVMLLAIVLLGRNLEARARLRASGPPLLSSPIFRSTPSLVDFFCRSLLQPPPMRGNFLQSFPSFFTFSLSHLDH
jgi:hypothetical protein